MLSPRAKAFQPARPPPVPAGNQAADLARDAAAVEEPALGRGSLSVPVSEGCDVQSVYGIVSPPIPVEAPTDIPHVSASSGCIVDFLDNESVHPTRASSYCYPPRWSHPRKGQLFYTAFDLEGFKKGTVNPESATIYGDMNDFTFGKAPCDDHCARRRIVLCEANSWSHWSRAPCNAPAKPVRVCIDSQPVNCQEFHVDDTPSRIRSLATVARLSGSILRGVCTGPASSPVDASARPTGCPENGHSSRRRVNNKASKPGQRCVPASAKSRRLKDMSDRDLIDLLYPSDELPHVDRTVAHIKAASASKLERCPKDKIVADTGATHKMWNRFEDFRTFCRLSGQSVLLPGGQRLAILGIGAVAIKSGGRLLYLWNVYLVEGLRVPLYSLRVHRRLPDCGHHADNDGFRVSFPTFDIEVNDEVDSYLTYESAPASPDEVFDYIEPTAAEIAQARASASHTASDKHPKLRRSQRLIEQEKKRLKNRERKQQK